MKVIIEIDVDGLVGYQFKDGKDNVVQFENLSRTQQVKVLNSFVSGYELFVGVLKRKDD